MTPEEYKKYKKSPEWEKLKNDRKRYNGHNHCEYEGCLNYKYLVMHHMIYPDTPEEDDKKNVCIYCNMHHTIYHGKIKINEINFDNKSNKYYKQFLILSNHYKDMIYNIENYKKIILEWGYYGEYYDNVFSEEENICELCGKENLRYEFRIENKLCDRSLFVGSSCIYKFGFEGVEQIYEDKRRMESGNYKKYAKNLYTRLPDNLMNIITKNITEFEGIKGFTPMDYEKISGYCNKRGIHLDNKYIKIDDNTEYYKNYIEKNYGIFENYLSLYQKETYEKRKIMRDKHYNLSTGS